jgi:hypothetical protein
MDAHPPSSSLSSEFVMITIVWIIGWKGFTMDIFLFNFRAKSLLFVPQHHDKKTSDCQ